MLKMPNEIKGTPALMEAYEKALENFLDHMMDVMDRNAQVIIDKDMETDTTRVRIRFQCDPVFSEVSVPYSSLHR